MENLNEHQVRRPGWKSSEFWITAIVAASPILLPLIERYVGTLPENSPYAIIGAGIVAAGYAFSRGQVKASRNLASGTQTQNAGTIVNEAPKVEGEEGSSGEQRDGESLPDEMFDVLQAQAVMEQENETEGEYANR